MNVCLFADEMQGVDRTHRIISANEKELFAAKAATNNEVPNQKGCRLWHPASA